MILLLRKPRPRRPVPGIEPAEEDTALGYRINLAVAGDERCLQKDAPLQRFGVRQ